MKLPSRNRAKTNITDIECPYCKHKYPISEETKDDYEMVENTKVHWCRECGFEFVNGVTRNVRYKYS